MLDIENLKRLNAATIPGSRAFEGGEMLCFIPGADEPYFHAFEIGCDHEDPDERQKMEREGMFIAAVHNVFPEIMAELERLQKVEAEHDRAVTAIRKANALLIPQARRPNPSLLAIREAVTILRGMP